jgi:Homeodomain-like domain
MNAYQKELDRCKAALMARAVIAAGGNQCAAAAELGLHRNTLSRVLGRAGYSKKALRALAREPRLAPGKKPPQAVRPEIAGSKENAAQAEPIAVS